MNKKDELNIGNDKSTLYESNEQEGDSAIIEEYKKGYFFMFHKVSRQYLARLQQLGTRLGGLFGSDNRKVVILFLTGLVSVSVFVGASFMAHAWLKSHSDKRQVPVHFETAPVLPVKSVNTNAQVSVKPSVPVPTVDQLQAEIKQMHADLEVSNQNMGRAMEMIQSHLTVLPSSNDIATLQANLSKPDQEITHTLDTINQSVNQIVAQTAQKSWVDPSTVQAYFQLVAVQGFSDGMRAVIDVDGHQMTLSDDEICPACRGWQLDHMDFSTQTAVFKKQVDNKTLFVSLRAN